MIKLLQDLLNKSDKSKNSLTINDEVILDCFDQSIDCEHSWHEIDPSRIIKETYFETDDFDNSGKMHQLDESLRIAIVNYFKSCGIKCDESNILVRRSIFDITDSIYKTLGLEKDGKVLMALPISNFFTRQCYDSGIAVEFLNTDQENNWEVEEEDLEKSLEKTKAKILLLNYPNSVTGAVMTQEDAEKIARVVRKYPDLIIIVDESLREIILDSKVQPFSLAAIEDIAPRVITINSLKNHGFVHLGVTFACIGNRKIADSFERNLANVSIQNQHIATLALTEEEDSKKRLTQIIEECKENTVLVKEEIEKINQTLSEAFHEKKDYIKSFSDPKAGNSFLLQFLGLKGSSNEDKTLNTDMDVANLLRKEASVSMIPGQGYLLPEEEMILRLYLMRSKNDLRIGFEKINKVLIRLRMLSKKLSEVSANKLEENVKGQER